MDAAAIALALVLGAVVLFGVWKNTYHSRAGALGLSLLGAAAIAAAAFGLRLTRPETDAQTAPGVLFLAERGVFEQLEARSRLSRDLDAALRAGHAPRLAIYGPPGPADVAPPGHLERSALRFPDLNAAAAWAQWEAGSDRWTTLQYDRSPTPPPKESWRRVNPFPPEQDVRSVDFAIPAECFVGTRLDVRARVVPNGVPLLVTLFRAGEKLEERRLTPDAPENRLTLTFGFKPEAPGQENLTLTVHNLSGRLVARRSAPVAVLERPLVRYYARQGRDPVLPALLRRCGFEVVRGGTSDLSARGDSHPPEGDRPELIVLDEVAPSALRPDTVQNLARAVSDRGATLLVIPGEMRSGSYKDAPVETLLPVWIGPKDDDKMGLAIVAVVDTSLSMAFLHDGVRKMDMAKEALLRLTAAVKPSDSVGILGVEDRPYWVLAPGQQRTGGFAEDRIRRILALGGGINLYSGLLEAHRGIQRTRAEIKHVVVFLDTADVDEYQVSGLGSIADLVDEFRRDGISLSIIGFGRGSDAHVPALSEIADAARGYFYLTSDLREVPGFFLRDLEEISKNVVLRRPMGTSFEEKEFPLLASTPDLQGQLVTTVKPDAFPFIWSDRGYPLVATRWVGKGTVSIFAADAGTDLARPWVDSAEAAGLWNTLLAKILARPAPTVQLFSTLRGTRAVAALKAPQSSQGNGGVEASWQPTDGPPSPLRLAETAPGEYEISVKASKPGPHLIGIQAAGGGRRLTEAGIDVPEADATGSGDKATLQWFQTHRVPRHTTLTPEDARFATQLLILAALAFFCLQEVFRVP